MTPEPEIPNSQPDNEGVQLDVNHYVRVLERKNADLLRQVSVLEAFAEQMREERDKAVVMLEEVSKESAPVHQGRVTKPKTRRPKPTNSKGAN